MSCLLIIAAISALFAVSTFAADDVVVLQPRHRTAQSLLPALEAAAGKTATIGIDSRTGRIIVQGDQAAIARVKKVLQQLDVPLRNVLVEWQRVGQTEYENLGIDVTWRVEGRGWRVGTLPLEGTERGGLVGTRGGVTKRIHRSTDASRQTVRVLEGGTAALVTGRKQGFSPDRVAVGRGRRPLVAGSIQDVQVSLMVRPRVVGEQIELAVFPQTVWFTDAGRQVQVAEDLATVVRIQSGEQFLLGSVTGQSQTTILQGVFEQLEQNHAATDTVYLMRATIEP
ncbi:MAG: secretin N-terminal domain-containing protein [Candidatus Lernaella stagnicola]|nr:secretin N-terminal domain-containing protein [Candidatus Lernaella stagnicola]